MSKTNAIGASIPEGLEIRNNSIRLNFMYKGFRCRETLKLSPTKSNIRFCTNLRAEILNKIARHDFNYEYHFPDSKLAKRLGIIKDRPEVNCSDLLEKQLINYGKMVENGYMSPSTFNGYRKVIKGQLIPAFGKYSILDITASMIKDWIYSLQTTPKTIRNYLTPLRNLFADVINDGLLAYDPIEQIALNKLIKITSKMSNFDAEPFNDDEKQEIINTAQGQVKNLFQFGFWSGLRTSELIALKWADIDFKRGVANISRAKVCNVEKGTKTKSGNRTIVLLPKAAEALTNQLNYTQGSDWVFHNPNTNTSWSSSEKVAGHWAQVLLNTSVKYRNCYQMRHTYASTLLSSGENPLWVSTQMGHKNVEMIFKRYGRWLPQKDVEYNFIGKY